MSVIECSHTAYTQRVAKVCGSYWLMANRKVRSLVRSPLKRSYANILASSIRSLSTLHLKPLDNKTWNCNRLTKCSATCDLCKCSQRERGIARELCRGVSGAEVIKAAHSSPKWNIKCTLEMQAPHESLETLESSNSRQLDESTCQVAVAVAVALRETVCCAHCFLALLLLHLKRTLHSANPELISSRG